MVGISSVRWTLVLGVGLLAAGCAGATWKQAQIAPGYQAPKKLNVAIVVQATGEEVGPAVQQMRDTLSAELRDRGIVATFSEGPLNSASAELNVVEWERGSQALRWLLFFGAGEGSMVVVVKSPSSDGQPGLNGQVRGWVRGGTFGGKAAEAASRAGRSIGQAIATGKAETD
jgi:hypothetical protein